MAGSRGISSFSVLLLMAVAAVVGVACLPRLKVQYNPTTASSEISVYYSYPGASARIVEAEVTSKLEGVLSSIREVSETNSVSEDGGGRTTASLPLSFKETYSHRAKAVAGLLAFLRSR